MHSNYSYWEDKTFFKHYDVIVIGSGIVGLNAAYQLKFKEPVLKVGVIEAGFLPTGASTKNAGFACFGSISEILNELKTSTEEEVLEVVEARWKGLVKLKMILGEKAIDYQNFGGYEVFKGGEEFSSLTCIENIPYFNKLFKSITGQTDIYAVANKNKAAVFGFSHVNSMIYNRCEAQIDTGKMMSALLGRVQEVNTPVFNNCKLLEIIHQENHVILKTNQGVFKTKKVIIATNGFINEFYPDLQVFPGRGQVLVTQQIPTLKIKGTFHYDKGFFYFRNINNRILLGGGRNIDFKLEETTQAGITDQVQSALEELLYETIIPDEKPIIEYRWSGVMAFGNELKPIIKKLEPNVFCSVRCNGMGVSMGSLSGQQVADLVLNEM